MLKSIYFLLPFFLFISYSFGQKKDFLTIQSEIEDGLLIATSPASFLQSYHKAHILPQKFHSKDDYFKSLKFLEKRSADIGNDAYFSILIQIVDKLQEGGNYQEAYYYLYKASELKKEVQSIEPEIRIKYNKNKGFSAFYFENLEEAEKHMQLALKCPGLNLKQQINFINTLGLIYKKREKYTISNDFFIEALELAKKSNDTRWQGVILGNLGHNYFLVGEYKRARALLIEDYNKSKANKNLGSAFSSLAILIECEIEEGNLGKAQTMFQELEGLLSDDLAVFEYRLFYETKTKLLEVLGDFKNAFHSFQNLVKYKDSIAELKSTETLKKTEFQINFEEETGKVKLLEERKKRNDLLYYGVLSFAGLALISLSMILYQIIRKRKREQVFAKREKERYNSELRIAEHEMRKILTNLREKNEIVDLLNQEIDQIQKIQQDSSSNDIQRTMKDKLQTFIILTDDDWIEFKRLFERLNPEYLDRVKKAFPDLTNAEIRLITLIKLNLSNIEISRTLGISPDSVRKTSLRLRKKLSIEQHEELMNYFLNF